MKLTAVIMTAAAILIMPLSASALETEQAEGYARGIVSFEKSVNGIKDKDSLLSGKIAEYAGTDSSDWLAIGAVRSGLETDTAVYYQSWKNNIDNKYLSDQSSGRLKATEWHRAVLTGLCLGADPTCVSSIDLLAGGTYGREENKPVGEQGLNGWIWALIALDSCDWKIPDDSNISRLGIINEILSQQEADGGFAVVKSNGLSDPDITAMTLQALSPYKDCPETQQSVADALDYLAKAQENFDNCETTAQTICALCCLGTDPDEDERFGKLTDELISYANDDGGFAHIKGEESNELASSQALLALCSLERLRNGERSIYDMNEGSPVISEKTSLAELTAEKNKNTSAPNTEVKKDVFKRTDFRLMTAAVSVIGAGVVTAAVILRRRKERAK